MKIRLSSALMLFVVVVVVVLLALVRPAPVAASSEYPAGPYWYAEFFDARWPTAWPVYTRYDTGINFDWATGSPNAAVPVDNFSVRWTRTVDFVGGVYKFWVIHDDGVLVWVDDQLVINQWYDQPAYTEVGTGLTTTTAPNAHYEEMPLSHGPHRIKIEYYEHGNNAVIKFGWVPVHLNPTPHDISRPSTLGTDSIHVVRPGEWLCKIARAYNVTVWAIIEVNNLPSTQIAPGQTLVIPNTVYAAEPIAPSPVSTGCRSVHTVSYGENLFRISLQYGLSYYTVAAHNGISHPYAVSVGQTLCVP